MAPNVPCEPRPAPTAGRADNRGRQPADRGEAGRPGQAGFSLLEVLVSVLILSVGLLGTAGLQIRSLQQNHDALLRSQALQLGNDMLDRMRANPRQDYAGVAFTDPPPNAPDCTREACSAARMKAFDLAGWKCAINADRADGSTHAICGLLGIEGSLGGGEGAIVDAGDDGVCPVGRGETCVVVRWDGRGGMPGGAVSLRARID